MDIDLLNLKTAVIVLAVLTTGLSAGLFYAWQVSVIPGTKQISHSNYLATMQSINREILNPRFFASFFGSIVLLTAATIWLFGSPAFHLFLAATLVYGIGTFGVTAAGNVPLNNQLDAVELQQLSPEKAQEIRVTYETPWNRFNRIRTWAAVLSFALSLIGLMAYAKAL